MCGIVGIFHYAEPDRAADRALLERMAAAVAHRGPDGEGIHLDGPLGLGHRRLAILDLTPTGAQPMANEDGSCWLTYNGEFYDHARYRYELEPRHRFRGRSDTETMLHLLEERGPAGLARVSAIFGLAFWDRRRRALTLARDPLGVKQVYFHDDGRRVLFASEIKALLVAADVPRELHPEALNEYLHFHSPLFERTFFRDVQQVVPGEAVTWTQGGDRRRTRYWELTEFSELTLDPADATAQLRERLGQVVSDQLMSDVPVGAFFSGGIDSSAVAAWAGRAGRPPRCFGVHFTDQGVIDERPFQEAAARALGLELELITLDGSSFPDDMPRLIRQQDQPVIGAAMLPMFHVSRLAAGRVKVCLGGQAADELFGGYARYSLAHPVRAALSIAGRQLRSGAGTGVAGNLGRQLAERTTLQRLAGNALRLADWRAVYFSNFARVPEAAWRDVIDAEEVLSRENCWLTFRETVGRSQAPDAATKAMHWDMQTYLPGLFQQDDRMSMAVGLESRVPLADPRLVEFAFRLPFALKVREGASKWLLRQAVADVLPPEVLNRRKVGFDTPIDAWMKGPHAGFVRDVLRSRAARERGLWRPDGLAALLDDHERSSWTDMVWKALCVELWARAYLDTTPVAAARLAVPELTAAPTLDVERVEPVTMADRAQELSELGPGGLAFRVRWEGMLRTGLLAAVERRPPALAPPATPCLEAMASRLPFDAEGVRRVMADRHEPGALERLGSLARAGARGRVLCFGRWVGDYGQPVDWQRNPTNGRRWSGGRHWTRVYREERRVGDIKMAWEIGRFPQAYRMARAGVHGAVHAAEVAAALAGQIEAFCRENPYGRGVHWASGQEVAFRLMAWLFAAGALRGAPPMVNVGPLVARHLYEGAAHVERHLEYTQRAVYNNHLLSEALALWLAGRLLPSAPEAERWRRRGEAILTEEAGRQFYPDGGYIQLSHNYERVALQVYLWAVAVARHGGQEAPPAWLAALGRGAAFLHAHQNPGDGRLPNYGANDGALPSVLSSCDYADFRPTLQAAHLAARGERLYPPGPWDEEAAWLLGPAALEAPLRAGGRASVSFGHTGFHVLRGAEPGSFGAFRCGSILDRFSQIDMLHLDVWWRGHNVLVDGGSYLYNGPTRWHDHFMRTGSHNTVMLDGRDQMLHFRRFKNLYWTKARLLRFEDQGGRVLAEGEHDGYRRHPGRCRHRRAVLFLKDDLWVVADTVSGEGAHEARLHWLGGPFEGRHDPAAGQVRLATPAGEFTVTVLDEAGRPLEGDLVAGRSSPPRGWLSRYYGEKEAAPSLAAVRRGGLPLTFVSVLAAGRPAVEVRDGCWRVSAAGREIAFTLRDGRFEDLT